MISSSLWRGVLADGTPASVRPIRPEDAEPLAEGLRRLSPESKVRRFLYEKGSFTPQELSEFTACDGIDHIALLSTATNEAGDEVEPIGVARSIRNRADRELAEAAIVVVDRWQGCGAGRILFRLLARRAWEAGIRRWQAVFLEENLASRALLDGVGEVLTVTPLGMGTVEAVYNLREPE